MLVAVRVVDVQLGEESFRYRTPIKFGGVALDRATILNAHVVIEDRQGRHQVGFGSMPLGNVWAFPSTALSYEQTLALMQEVAEEAAYLTREHRQFGHPIELNHDLEPAYLQAGTERSMPKLATLVAASPIDAAIHDAYGKLQGLSSYSTYGREFLNKDVGSFLGEEFANVWITDHVAGAPVPSLPLYHLVGALDALTPEEVAGTAKQDGYPMHLLDWIKRDQLTHLKIKLNGDDLGWDVDRVLRVESAAKLAQMQRGCTSWSYSLDFNEKCKNVEYLLDFLRQLEEQSPQALSRVQYIEQPTARDLKANPKNKMHAVSKRVPVVIDESLIDLESLQLAREQGYTGVALKACKGQSTSLLLASAARHYGMFLCVQDLTCPGPSLIHSAGLAAHVRGVAAIEANARQYLPAANERWKRSYPGLFEPVEGRLLTGQLTGPGLGVS
ncbi:MAG TPA: mandelate racemase/muconate lactonizing enzyme family protein [Gemmatales bacterium]|nr:mandelate racemase/muconate lactonizing enzyme family protein [Gemmatales bacterium]